MIKLINFHLLANTGLAIAAVLTARTETLADSLTVARVTGQNKPTVPFWHVFTDENGVSHQQRSEFSAFQFRSIAEGAAPSWIDKKSTPGTTMLVVVQPVGWVGEWHENPKPQWIIPLSGRWFVETMDGKRVEMGPGEVSFGGDQNTRMDAHGRKGHRSGTVGNQPSVNLIVQLEKNPFIEGLDSTRTTAAAEFGTVDAHFVTQTSLDTPLELDSGRIAQVKGGTQAIHDHAELLARSHAANDIGRDQRYLNRFPLRSLLSTKTDRSEMAQEECSGA